MGIAIDMLTRYSHSRICFIHRAICLDPQGMFIHPRAIPQRGFSLVATPCIDTRQTYHCPIPPIFVEGRFRLLANSLYSTTVNR